MCIEGAILCVLRGLLCISTYVCVRVWVRIGGVTCRRIHCVLLQCTLYMCA